MKAKKATPKKRRKAKGSADLQLKAGRARSVKGGLAVAASMQPRPRPVSDPFLDPHAPPIKGD